MRIPYGLTMVLLLETSALAQVAAPGVPTTTQTARAPKPDDWTIGIGFAPIFSPAWQGSRDKSLSIFPDLRVNYRETLFFSVPDGLGWNLINMSGWRIGPVFKFRFGRSEDNGGSIFLLSGGSDALIGMGDVGFAGEPGAFVQYGFADRKARVRAELRQGIGGHKGLVADTSVGWSDMIGKPTAPGRWLYSTSLRATFAGANYTNTYFGVNEEQSAATGLDVSMTGEGLVSTGINMAIIKPLGQFSQRGALTLFGGYDRLADTAADSSLIVERGQRDQLSIGLSYGIRFGFGRGRKE